MDASQNIEAISLLLASITEKQETMSLDDWMQYVDEVEARIASHSPQYLDCNVKHRFADGMYIRECFLPKGVIGISNIHNTTHPFVILEGMIRVRTHEGQKVFHRGYFGITKPLTRRVLYAIEDTRWVTFHATELTSVTEIMQSILLPRVNPLLSENQLHDVKCHVDKSNLALI